MNKSILRGQRVRILATDELGTVAEKVFIKRKGSQRPSLYCRVRLDKKPDEDRWYWADQLGDTKEQVVVTLDDERGRRLILSVTKYHDKPSDENNMHVELSTGDGGCLRDHSGGMHFALAAMLLKALAGADGQEPSLQTEP